MNRFKSWQDQLLSLIGQGIERYGFEKRPKGRSFTKKCPFGCIKFHLAFIKHEDDFDVTADVAIRFDQVEELVNRFGEDPLLKDQERANTCTIGCELGNLSDGQQKRWTILSADDVPVVADAIISTFAEVGLPYIEKFSDEGHVLKVLSGDGPDSWLHSPLDGERAKKAVGMALITQGKEAAQSLAKLKLSFLEERKDFGLSLFRSFLNQNGLG